jgi:predicted nucleic acid-binding protein
MGLCIVCQAEEENASSEFIGALCTQRLLEMDKEKITAWLNKLTNPEAIRLISKHFLHRTIDLATANSMIKVAEAKAKDKDIVAQKRQLNRSTTFEGAEKSIRKLKKLSTQTGKAIVTATQGMRKLVRRG